MNGLNQQLDNTSYNCRMVMLQMIHNHHAIRVIVMSLPTNCATRACLADGLRVIRHSSMFAFQSRKALARFLRWFLPPETEVPSNIHEPVRITPAKTRAGRALALFLAILIIGYTFASFVLAIIWSAQKSGGAAIIASACGVLCGGKTVFLMTLVGLLIPGMMFFLPLVRWVLRRR